MKKFILKTSLYLSLFLGISIYFYFTTKHNLITRTSAKQFAIDFNLHNLVQKAEICEDRMAVVENIIFHKNTHVNTLIIGSSRVMQLGKFTHFSNALNLGVSGANFYDIDAIYKLVCQNNIEFDTLIFDFNPWTVCESVENRYTQFSKFEICKKFLKDVFTFNYSKNDIEYALNLNKKAYYPATFADISDPNKFIKFTDGSIKQITLSKIKKAGRVSTFCKDLYLLKKFYNIDKQLFKKAKQLIELNCDQKPTYLVLCPFHPQLFEQNHSDIRIKKIALLEKLVNLNFNPKVHIIGSFYPSNFQFTDSNFIDGFHLSENSISKLFWKHVKPSLSPTF